MVNIDKTDKIILYELYKNSRIPETKLAKIIGKSKESVRYRIKKLTEQKIILKYSLWIDPAITGFQTAKCYLKLINNPAKKRELIEYIKKDKRLFWLGIGEGNWNLGITYFVKSNHEFYEIKRDLASKYGEIIQEIHLAAPIEIKVGEMTNLYQKEFEWSIIAKEQKNNKYDETDRAILKELYKNSRKNVVEISRNINSTISTVRGRMKKMEEEGLIVKYTIAINYEKLGFQFFKSFLYFNNLTKKDEQKIIEYCKQDPNILHVVKQISDWDIELEIMCETYKEYNEIINHLTQEFSHSIKKVETTIMSEDHVYPSKAMFFE